MKNTTKFMLYVFGIILITTWIYIARLFFGYGYGWELLIYVFFAPPFFVLIIFTILGLRASFRKNPQAPTVVQNVLYFVAIIAGIFVGLTSPILSDATKEMSVLVHGDVSTVYAMAVFSFSVFAGALAALMIVSYVMARKKQPVASSSPAL
jgi:4-hydroxybenzoate polyprenyltransferase